MLIYIDLTTKIFILSEIFHQGDYKLLLLWESVVDHVIAPIIELINMIISIFFKKLTGNYTISYLKCIAFRYLLLYLS